MLLYGNICPIVPRRYTHLLRQLINAKYGASLVAARNDQLVVDGLDDVFLRLAFQVFQHTLFHPVVDKAVAANGSYDDSRCRELF